MKISNVRLGFATNSSSSHSIVIVPSDRSLEEDIHDEDYYGWEEFVLMSEQPKMRYLAVQLYYSLKEQLGIEIAKYIVSTMFKDIELDYDNCGVDHQSSINFPVDVRTGNVSIKFIEEFKQYLQRSDVAILGGNDNVEEKPKEWKNLKQTVQYFTDYNGSGVLCAKNGDWWTLFNKYSGTKISTSFKNNPEPRERTAGPELVDLKITDWCPFECPFCYQGSTKVGKIADLRLIEYILKALPKIGVFEVAIGGGEPTLYPYFTEVLKIAHDVGLVVNFTTKVLPTQWKGDLLDAVKQYVSGVAISLKESTHIEELHHFGKLHNIKFSAQFIVGAHEEYWLPYMIRECATYYIPLTLLGYKDVGMGKAYAKKEQKITPELLQSGYAISADTAFITEYRDVLKAANINRLLYVKGEGLSSMYIDAVEQNVNISSYSSKEPKSFDASHSWFLDEDLQKLWESLL